MGFEVVEGSPRSLWAPIVDSDVIRVGSIVACQANEGVVPMGAASGANDTTNKLVPWGVVIGTNAKTPVTDTTNLTEQITDASPHGSTTEYVSHEGVWYRGDRQAMVNIALITPETILKGPLYNAAVGTAPTVATATAGSAAGVTVTGNAVDSAGVAVLSTVYFRSGPNMGQYRITDDTSTTVVAWDKPTVNDTTVGDTYVRVNLRALGPSRAQFDAEALYIDVAAALTADYYGIDVIKLDLREAGKEHAYFKFNIDQFSLLRT